MMCVCVCLSLCVYLCVCVSLCIYMQKSTIKPLQIDYRGKTKKKRVRTRLTQERHDISSPLNTLCPQSLKRTEHLLRGMFILRNTVSQDTHLRKSKIKKGRWTLTVRSYLYYIRWVGMEGRTVKRLLYHTYSLTTKWGWKGRRGTRSDV